MNTISRFFSLIRLPYHLVKLRGLHNTSDMHNKGLKNEDAPGNATITKTSLSKALEE